jgi:exosortase B
MSSLPLTSAGIGLRGAIASPWTPVLAGMALLYVPTLVDLFSGTWSQSTQAHGPIILMVSLWLLSRLWRRMDATTAGARGNAAGYGLILVGMLAYVVGRSQGIQFFELGSCIWTLTGAVVVLRGFRALKMMWFPVFFMCFMIPLPGPVVDALTMPMKTAVSHVVENLLSAAGYPIGRSGVILQIGQYKLLVADACAGLHTLFTLEAMGLLYLNLVRGTSAFRNVTLAILIVPISFSANVIRVLVLTLITFYLGDEAGQGFLHRFAGMVLFITALLMVISVDGILRKIDSRRAIRASTITKAPAC